MAVKAERDLPYYPIELYLPERLEDELEGIKDQFLDQHWGDGPAFESGMNILRLIGDGERLSFHEVSAKVPRGESNYLAFCRAWQWIGNALGFRPCDPKQSLRRAARQPGVPPRAPS